MTGEQYAESWKVAHTPTDFFFLKSYVMNILHRMRVNMSRLETKPTACGYLSEGIDMVYRDSQKVLVSMGVVSKAVLNMMDCKQPVFYADINWDLLLKNYPKKEVTFSEIPRFPEVRRDLALVVNQNVTFEQIEQVAYATEKKLLQRVGLFDVYEGKGIAAGTKSYAVSFILQDKDKTLNDKQIEATMEKIQKNLESQLGAKLR